MITKEQYENLKPKIIEYEKEQKRLSRSSGISKSKCPFCGGSKTKPFVRQSRSQDCTECDKNGMISNRRLEKLGLWIE
jgi:hypothetical protein